MNPDLISKIRFEVLENTDDLTKWIYKNAESELNHFNIVIEFNKKLDYNMVIINWSTEDDGEDTEYFEEELLILTLFKAYEWADEIPMDRKMSNVLWNVINEINDNIIKNK